MMNHLNLCDYGKAKVYLWKTEKTSEKLFSEISNKLRSLYEKINYDDLFHHLYTYIKYINGSDSDLFIRYEEKICDCNINKNIKDDDYFFSIFKNANYVRRNGNLSISYIDLIDKNIKIDRMNFFSNIFMSIGIHELYDEDIYSNDDCANKSIEKKKKKKKKKRKKKKKKKKKNREEEEEDDENFQHEENGYFNKLNENIINLINSYNNIFFSNSCVFIQRVLVIPSSDKYDDIIMMKIMEINDNFLYKNKNEDINKNNNISNISKDKQISRIEEFKNQEKKNNTGLGFLLKPNISFIKNSPYYDSSNNSELSILNNSDTKHINENSCSGFNENEKSLSNKKNKDSKNVVNNKLRKKYSSHFLRMFNKSLAKEYKSLNVNSDSDDSDDYKLENSIKQKNNDMTDNLNDMENISNSDINEIKKKKNDKHFSFICDNFHNFKIIIFLPSIKKHFNIQYNKFFQAIIFNIFYIFIFFLYDLLTKDKMWKYIHTLIDNTNYEKINDQKVRNDSILEERKNNRLIKKKKFNLKNNSNESMVDKLNTHENVSNSNNNIYNSIKKYYNDIKISKLDKENHISTKKESLLYEGIYKIAKSSTNEENENNKKDKYEEDESEEEEENEEEDDDDSDDSDDNSDDDDNDDNDDYDDDDDCDDDDDDDGDDNDDDSDDNEDEIEDNEDEIKSSENNIEDEKKSIEDYEGEGKKKRKKSVRREKKRKRKFSKVKNYTCRIKKKEGDIFLLLGSPLDSLEIYMNCYEISKMQDDFIYEGNIIFCIILSTYLYIVQNWINFCKLNNNENYPFKFAEIIENMILQTYEKLLPSKNTNYSNFFFDTSYSGSLKEKSHNYNFHFSLYNNDHSNDATSTTKNINLFINLLNDNDDNFKREDDLMDIEDYYFFNILIKPHNILLYLVSFIEYKLNEVLSNFQNSSCAHEYFCDYLLCYLNYLLMLKKKRYIFLLSNKYSYVVEKFEYNLYIKYYMQLALIYKYIGAFRKFSFTIYLLCLRFFLNKQFYLSYFFLNNLLPFYNLPSIHFNFSFRRTTKSNENNDFNSDEILQFQDNNCFNHYIHNIFVNRTNKINVPFYWLRKTEQTLSKENVCVEKNENKVINSNNDNNSNNNDKKEFIRQDSIRSVIDIYINNKLEKTNMRPEENKNILNTYETNLIKNSSNIEDDKNIIEERKKDNCYNYYMENVLKNVYIYSIFDNLFNSSNFFNVSNLFNFCSRDISSKSIFHLNKHTKKLQIYKKNKKTYNTLLQYDILCFLSSILKEINYSTDLAFCNLLMLLFLHKHLSKQKQKEILYTIYETLNKKKKYIYFPPFINLILDEKRKKKNRNYLRKLDEDNNFNNISSSTDSSKMYDLSTESSSSFDFISFSNVDSHKKITYEEKLKSKKIKPKKKNSKKENKLHFLYGFTEGRCSPLPILVNIEYVNKSYNNEKIYKKVELSNTKKKEADIDLNEYKDVFKYNPFTEEEKNVKIQNICAVNEIKNVIVTLKNTLSINLVLNNVALISSGISIENYPTSVILLSKKKNNLTKVQLSFKAKETGMLFPLGISYCISYFYFNQYLLYDTSILRKYFMDDNFFYKYNKKCNDNYENEIRKVSENTQSFEYINKENNDIIQKNALYNFYLNHINSHVHGIKEKENINLYCSENDKVLYNKIKLLHYVFKLSNICSIFVIDNYFSLKSEIKLFNFSKYINIKSLLNDKSYLKKFFINSNKEVLSKEQTILNDEKDIFQRNHLHEEKIEGKNYENKESNRNNKINLKNSFLDEKKKYINDKKKSCNNYDNENINKTNECLTTNIDIKKKNRNSDNVNNLCMSDVVDKSNLFNEHNKSDCIDKNIKYNSEKDDVDFNRKKNVQSCNLSDFTRSLSINSKCYLNKKSSKKTSMCTSSSVLSSASKSSSLFLSSSFSSKLSEKESSSEGINDFQSSSGSLVNLQKPLNYYELRKDKSENFDDINDNYYFSCDPRYSELLEGEIKFLCLIFENKSNINIDYINITVRHNNKINGDYFIKFFFDNAFCLKSKHENNKEKIIRIKKNKPLKVKKNYSLYIPIRCIGSILINECDINILYSSNKNSSYYALQNLNLKINVKKNISIENIFYFPYVSFNYKDILNELLNSNYYDSNIIKKLGSLKRENNEKSYENNKEIIHDINFLKTKSFKYKDINIDNYLEKKNTQKKDSNINRSLNYNDNYDSDNNNDKIKNFKNYTTMNNLVTKEDSFNSFNKMNVIKKDNDINQTYKYKESLNICTDNKYIFLELYIKNFSGYVNYCKTKKLKRRPMCIVDKENNLSKWILWIKRIKRKKKIIFENEEDILKYFLQYLDFYVYLTFSRHKKTGILSVYSSYLNNVHIHNKTISDFFFNFKKNNNNNNNRIEKNETDKEEKHFFLKLDDEEKLYKRNNSLGEKNRESFFLSNGLNILKTSVNNEEENISSKNLNIEKFSRYLKKEEKKEDNNCNTTTTTHNNNNSENFQLKLKINKLFHNSFVNDIFYPYILIKPKFHNCKKRNSVIIPKCSKTLNFTDIKKIGIKKKYFESSVNEFFCVKIFIENLSLIDLGKYTLIIYPSNLNCIKIIGSLNISGYLYKDDFIFSKKNKNVDNFPNKKSSSKKLHFLHSFNVYSLFTGKVLFYIALYFHDFHTLLFYHEPILVTVV
ncbi:conserved Plasmodium protein, unknown function [Plasmodium gallinaceum]|uniref:Trs120/TRAPPC9 first Ig-like domain-containing protein n=1 Tax=Plasmodium gallinaceum TaxID=5849 RepID=A0A1J1GPB7_PLAGA|nr:conserved Plasmodium protein, unknown function [Plasmodium gallinaceum]CRG93127.1 conserved Plasmodium protein, unknown function [Plasmodium gallinaceum]